MFLLRDALISCLAVVNLDSQLVEQTAFPVPNATLLSPAFLKSGNASFDPGWFTGSEGATSHDELSMVDLLQLRKPETHKGA